MECCRWMDGVFSDLNPDSLAIELEDYSKETYKLMKVFLNRFKKLQVQRDDRERERKKNARRRSTISGVADPEYIAMQQAEPPAVPPAAISVCQRVITQQQDFRVNSTALSLSLQSLLQVHHCAVYMCT